MDNQQDISLLERIKQDDQEAFAEIYRKYWKKLLMIAWNHSKDRSISKDIVHEVFLSLWERRHLVEIHDLSAFLATSIKFSVFKHYEKEHRRSALAKQHYLTSLYTEDEKKLDAMFLQEYVNGIVEEMPEKCRLVFKFSRESGLKNAEIAEKIAVTEKAVEATLTRALKILRNELKNAGILKIMFSLLPKGLSF